MWAKIWCSHKSAALFDNKRPGEDCEEVLDMWGSSRHVRKSWPCRLKEENNLVKNLLFRSKHIFFSSLLLSLFSLPCLYLEFIQLFFTSCMCVCVCVWGGRAHTHTQEQPMKPTLEPLPLVSSHPLSHYTLTLISPGTKYQTTRGRPSALESSELFKLANPQGGENQLTPPCLPYIAALHSCSLLLPCPRVQPLCGSDSLLIWRGNKESYLSSIRCQCVVSHHQQNL